MWRFIGVLSLLLLPYAVNGVVVEGDIAPCPDNKVCVVFYEKNYCRRGHATDKTKYSALIWDEHTSCGDGANREKMQNGDLYAKLDIEVVDPQTWNIVVSFNTDPDENKFEFSGGSLMTFANDGVATFTWAGKSKTFKMDEMEKIQNFEYKFTFDLNGERIGDIIGDYIKYTEWNAVEGDTVETIDSSDAVGGLKGFAGMIAWKTPCFVSNLHEADPCTGPCISLTNLSMTGLIITKRFCQKTLWYHNKDEDPESKNWAEVKGIACDNGYWSMETDQSNGTALGKVGDSLEFQCSESVPTHPFPMGAKIGLAIGGGIGLLVIMGVIGFFIWRHFERKDAKTASAMGIVTGFRPQDLPKGYLDKPKSMRNDLPIGSARTPGDEGTQKEKDAGTPASPADTPTPDNKP